MSAFAIKPRARPLVLLAALLALLVAGAAAASAASVRVAPGETLSEIAARAGVGTGALAAANGISDPDHVVSGRALVIPSGSSSWSGSSSSSGGSHTVRPGETLSEIAARAGVGTGALAAANGISDPDLVVAGRSLTIPSGSGSTSSWSSGSSSSSSSSGGSYRVRPGDTLSHIAARAGVGTGALAAANGISHPDQVMIGRSLTIPSGSSAASTWSGASSSSGGSHTVRPGETLGEIAARSGVSTSALAAANGISDPDLVVAGRSLAIPGASAATAPARSMPTGDVRALIDSHAAAYGVDPSLARAIAWQESGWNQNMVSHAGAVGVMQLMPDTSRWLGSDVLGRSFDPNDVDDNIEGGVAYLKWLTNRVGDSPAAIAAYYQGLHSVRQRGFYDDTEQYVRSVQSLRGTR